MQADRVGQASSASLGANLLKTALQFFAVYAIFLCLIPTLLVHVEMAASIATFASPKWQGIGLVLFMAMTTLQLICAWNLIWLGEGTPWPWDHSTRFVVAGPYRYLRHPMALAGIVLGIAAALIMGSWLSLVYVGIGAALWQFVLKPIEEEDMARRFQRPYIEYFQSVPAYLPRLSPYRAFVVESVASDEDEEPAQNEPNPELLLP